MWIREVLKIVMSYLIIFIFKIRRVICKNGKVVSWDILLFKIYI